MPHRIHDNITHGEIDCRVKGEVTGKLWPHGGGEPIVLQLTGNAWPDMAGCELSFVNKGGTVPLRQDLSMASVQNGSVGDMTASRKVRIPAVPIEEFCERTMKGEKPPERLANSLYLEWFSETNGRVVFESAECEITLSTPQWRLTPEEEEQRAKDAAAGMDSFMESLTQAIDLAESKVPWGKEEWDEFDHEKLLRESDARTDKLGELMEKYMDDPDRDRIIAREMGWTHIEEMLDAQDLEGEAKGDEEDESSDGGGSGEDAVGWEVPDLEDYKEPEPDPATEGKDWIRTEKGDIRHPLQHRAFEGAIELWHRLEELGLKEARDDDVAALVGEYQILSAKLAGALNGLAQNRPHVDYAHIIARMKRGLTHLHEAQAALVRVGERKLLPEEDLGKTRTELFAIREEMLRLMEEFRQLP